MKTEPGSEFRDSNLIETTVKECPKKDFCTTKFSNVRFIYIYQMRELE